MSRQFQVEASDQADSPRTKHASVNIQFKRDKAPRFDNLPREQRVSENSKNNDVVYKVQGRDDDKQVGIHIDKKLPFRVFLWLEGKFSWASR